MDTTSIKTGQQIHITVIFIIGRYINILDIDNPYKFRRGWGRGKMVEHAEPLVLGFKMNTVHSRTDMTKSTLLGAPGASPPRGGLRPKSQEIESEIYSEY